MRFCGLMILVYYPSVSAAFELWGTGAFSNSTFLVTSESHVRYRHVPDKLEHFEDRDILDYVEQVQRFNAVLTKDQFTLGAQFDEVALFGNRYILDGELIHERDLYDDDVFSPFPDALMVLEKAFVQRRWSNGEVTVGDTYASFGRGIGLNIVKNTAIDIDTSIRGAKVDLTTGDLELLLVSGLTNQQQINRLNVNVDIQEGISHMVSGAQLMHYGVGPAQVGIHSTIARFGRQVDADDPGLLRYTEELDAIVGGMDIEMFSMLGMDLYVEGDLFHYQTPEMAGQDEPLRGHILYGSTSFYPGPLTVLIEAKTSENTERINAFVSADGWEFSTAPTLEYERVITEDSSAAVNSEDVFGVRGRVDLSALGGDLIPYVSVMGLRDQDTGGLHFNASPETVMHPVFGAQWLPGKQVLVINAGYRQDIRDESSEGSDRLTHVDAEFSTPVFGEELIEIAVSAKRFQWGNNPQGQQDFIEMENALVWKHGTKMDFVFYQDWSNNPLIPSTGNLGDELYGAFEIKYKPKPSTQLAALVGAYKAGIRCSGGQCRTLPGFEGGQISYTTQF